MRLLAAALLLGILALPVVPAHGDGSWPPGNHSEHVVDFFWEPREPARGQAVSTRLTLAAGTEVEQALLRVCRVENYACRAPIGMTDQHSATRAQYAAEVPWDGRFYRGVTEVGLAVILRYANGTSEESPRESWPGPANLPEGGGQYYFYDLPPDSSKLPGLGTVGTLGLLLATLWRRR